MKSKLIGILRFYAKRMLKLKIVAHTGAQALTHIHLPPQHRKVNNVNRRIWRSHAISFRFLLVHLLVYFVIYADVRPVKSEAKQKQRHWHTFCFCLWLLLFNMVKWGELLIPNVVHEWILCDASFFVQINNFLRSTRSHTRMRKRHPMQQKVLLLIVHTKFKVHAAIIIMMKMEIKEGMRTNCPIRLWAVNQVLVFRNSFTFLNNFDLQEQQKMKRNQINYIND